MKGSRAQLVVLAAIITLLSLALRMAALERRPLHFDEGNNVYFGQQRADVVLRDSIDTIDTDPPGHRFGLGLWMGRNGASPFSIRYFSVWFAVLATATMVAIARELRTGAGAGLIAAFC